MVKRNGVTHCLNPQCGIEVRRASDPKRDGTRRYGGRGLCSTCVSRERTGARPKTEVPPFCDRCDRPQRVRSAPPDGVTVPYHGNGLCQWCYDTTARRALRHEAAWIKALGIATEAPDDTEGSVT